MDPKPGQARTDANRSFERLYQGHRDEVYRAALRALGNADDAEDVTQAAFVDAYRAILRGSRPSAPRAWLFAIAENVRRRRFRTALRRPREEPLGPELGAAELAHEQADSVRRALTALTRQQREAFLLREVHGFAYDEIAEKVGSTVASVQMHLFRARLVLRAELDPPAVPKQRRALALHLPTWVASLAGRGDALTAAPRGAAAVGATVLAATAVTAGGLHMQQRDVPRAEPVVREQVHTRTAQPARPVPVSDSAVPDSTPVEAEPVVARPVVARPVVAQPVPAAPEPPAPAAVPAAASAPVSPAPPEPRAPEPTATAPPASLPVPAPAPGPPTVVSVPPAPVLPPPLPVLPRATPALPAPPPPLPQAPAVVVPAFPELPELPEPPEIPALVPVAEPPVLPAPTLP